MERSHPESPSTPKKNRNIPPLSPGLSPISSANDPDTQTDSRDHTRKEESKQVGKSKSLVYVPSSSSPQTSPIFSKKSRSRSLFGSLRLSKNNKNTIFSDDSQDSEGTNHSNNGSASSSRNNSPSIVRRKKTKKEKELLKRKQKQDEEIKRQKKLLTKLEDKLKGAEPSSKKASQVLFN